MEKGYSALCQRIVLYTHYSNFECSILLNFTNEITLKQSLAQKSNLFFKFSPIKRQIFQ